MSRLAKEVKGIADEIETIGSIVGYGRPEARQLREHSETLSKVAEILDTPETEDFLKALELEQQHQRARWGIDHDEQKSDDDWFWLIAFLAGKAKQTEFDPEKKRHRLIATAAALMNWHSQVAPPPGPRRDS